MVDLDSDRRTSPRSANPVSDPQHGERRLIVLREPAACARDRAIDRLAGDRDRLRAAAAHPPAARHAGPNDVVEAHRAAGEPSRTPSSALSRTCRASSSMKNGFPRDSRAIDPPTHAAGAVAGFRETRRASSSASAPEARRRRARGLRAPASRPCAAQKRLQERAVGRPPRCGSTRRAAAAAGRAGAAARAAGPRCPRRPTAGRR